MKLWRVVPLLLFLLLKAPTFGSADDDEPSEDQSQGVEEKPYLLAMNDLEKFVIDKAGGWNNEPKTPYVYLHMPRVQHLNLDENSQIFTASIRLQSTWIDERLGWNTQQFPIDHLSLQRWELWTPSFEVLNRVANRPTYYNREPVIIRNARQRFFLTHLSSINADVHCPIDASAYPYDTQKCSVVIGMASRYQHIKLRAITDWGMAYTVIKTTDAFFEKAHISDFEITNISHVRSSIDSVIVGREQKVERDAVIFEFTLRRHAPYHLYVDILPSTVFIVLSASAMVLSDARHTLMIFLLNLLLLTLWMSALFPRLPVHYSTAPRCVVFIAFQLMLSFGGMITVAVRVYRGNRTKASQETLPTLSDETKENTNDEDSLSTTDPECSPECLNARLLSLPALFAVLSCISGLILLMPTIY